MNSDDPPLPHLIGRGAVEVSGPATTGKTQAVSALMESIHAKYRIDGARRAEYEHPKEHS